MDIERAGSNTKCHLTSFYLIGRVYVLISKARNKVAQYALIIAWAVWYYTKISLLRYKNDYRNTEEALPNWDDFIHIKMC